MKRYGAFELKKGYQKGLGGSVVLAGLGMILVVLGLLWASSIFSKPETGRIVRIKSLLELGLPIMIVEDEPKEPPATEGQPVPSPKAQVFHFGTPYHGKVHEGLFYDPTVNGVAGSNQKGWIEISSPPNHMEVLGELPRCRHIVLPDPPDSMVEATVWVRILIDSKGNIREIFVKESVLGYGSLVVAAVEQWEYTAVLGDKDNGARWSGFIVKFRPKQT